MALTFAENFRSIGLTEEAPDEFCGRAEAGAGQGRGTEGCYILYRKIRPLVQGLKGLISKNKVNDSWHVTTVWPPFI